MKRAWALFVLGISIACRADVLILDDGTRMEGKVRKDGDQWVVTDAAGKQTRVDQERITSFELDGGRGKNAPAKRLGILHQTVDDLSDITQILARYDTFIQSTPAGSVLDQARQERDQWQAKLAEGEVKVGGHWLGPAEQAARFGAEAEEGQRIIGLIRDGKTADAQKALKQAIADDPENSTALYLSGLLAAQAGQYTAARAELEQVNKVSIKDAPALNNLAVVLWHQGFFGGALNNYNLAMAADPANKTILDNVAEAMEALPADNPRTPPAAAAAAMFARQEAALEARQGAAGLSRWGARWVPSGQLPRLQAEEQAVQGELSNLAADEQQTLSQIASDDSQIATEQQALSNAQTVQSLPGNFPQMQQDLTLLQQAREVGVDHLKELQARADRLQRSFSTPKFTGKQALIGPEGAPIRTATAGSAAARSAAGTQPVK